MSHQHVGTPGDTEASRSAITALKATIDLAIITSDVSTNNTSNATFTPSSIPLDLAHPALQYVNNLALEVGMELKVAKSEIMTSSVYLEREESPVLVEQERLVKIMDVTAQFYTTLEMERIVGMKKEIASIKKALAGAEKAKGKKEKE